MDPDRTGWTPQAIDVIASGVHDAKNSLFDALTRLDLVGAAIGANDCQAARNALSDAHRTVARTAERLTLAMSAYRLARHEDPVSLVPCSVADLLAYARMRVDESCGGVDAECPAKDLAIVCNVDEEWLLDRELVADCLVNAIANARRHARSRVQVEARVDTADAPGTSGFLLITVADDGEGYPPSATPEKVLPGPSRSGVGLFVTAQVAALHRVGGRNGSLHLANGAPLGGAVFTLRLP
jgi:two-component system, OmpR family, sensor histidine kinase SenX3